MSAYGYHHQRRRAAFAPHVEAGEVSCRSCGRLILPRQPWDLGRGHFDRSLPSFPECRKCNRVTAGRSARSAPPRQNLHSRIW